MDLSGLQILQQGSVPAQNLSFVPQQPLTQNDISSIFNGGGVRVLQQGSTPVQSSPTYSTPAPSAPVSQGAVSAGIPSGDIQAQQAWEQRAAAERARWENDQRNQINSGWDNYLGSLNDIGNTYLPQQRDAQQGIADTSFNQGQDTINSQKASSLKDITNNIRNAFQAGNVYLGSRGAGDSSAANQYSFAVQQSANKQVGNLNDYTNTQLNSLRAQHDTAMNQIAQWFAQAQQQLKQQVAQGGLGRSQDLQNLSQNILNQALTAANQVKADTSARYNALLGWAANNSHNVGQLQANIAGIPQAIGNPQMSGANTPFMPVGQDTTKRTDMFGNPIG